MDGSALAQDATPAPPVGRGRRLAAWLRDQAGALAQIAVRICDAVRRPPATTADEPSADSGPGTPADGTAERPQWALVAVLTAVFAVLVAFGLSPTTALYWYAFPLFGIGIAYVVQFRSELTARWWAVLAGSAVVSAVALAQDWAFSGHVLFNVLLLGHAAQSSTRRTWIRLLLASLVELFVLKVGFQRPMDSLGGVISVAVAIVALAIAGPKRSVATR